MSRFDQPADDRELDDHVAPLTRDCARCGEPVPMDADEPFGPAPLCDDCHRETRYRAVEPIAAARRRA